MIQYGSLFILFRFSNPVVKLRNILRKGIGRQETFATAENNVFTTNNFENYDLKAPNPL